MVVGRRLIGDAVRYFCNFGEFIVHTAGPRPLTRIINVAGPVFCGLYDLVFSSYTNIGCAKTDTFRLSSFFLRQDGLLDVAHFSSRTTVMRAHCNHNVASFHLTKWVPLDFHELPLHYSSKHGNPNIILESA